MSDRRPNLEILINAWKEEHGTVRVSERGVSYIVMPASKMLESMKILAQTLLDSGFSFEEINGHDIRNKIANIVWREDKILKMSNSEIKRAKLSTIEDWKQAIAKFAGYVFSKVEPLKVEEYRKPEPIEQKPDPKPEKPIEIDPSNRLKVDTTGYADAIPDLDFLAELGISPSEDENGH